MSTKILLVEDEPDLQVITRMALEDAHYTVAVASNGLEALSILDRESFDLLLIDLLMPKMDGLELCQHLRQHPVWQHIPVLLLTANPKAHLSNHDFHPAVRGWVEKPFNVFELVDYIQSILNDAKT